MTTTTPAPTVRNGVPVDKLFGTINKLKADPDLAAFAFTAKNKWIDGTACQSTIHEWSGVGTDHLHVEEFTFKADHPTLGLGHGPTPHEYLLHALASCVVAGVATTAAARKIELTSIEATVKGSMDVRGILGIEADVRNGFSKIVMDIDVQGDAPAEVLEALVESSRDHSAVFDTLTGVTPVEIRTNA